MKKLKPEDKYVLTAELASNTLYCDLWHPEEYTHIPKAIDFIIQEFKHPDGDSFTLSIPVCSNCIEYLLSGVLKLFFCYKCGHSAWKVNLEIVEVEGLKDNITWSNGCSECNEGS